MNSDSQSHPDLDVQRIRREGRFSDEEVQQIYHRASEIQSQAWLRDDSGLSDVEMERGANRAGISDAALEQAIKERDADRQRAQEKEKQKAAQKAVLTQRLIAGAVVFAVLAGGNLLVAKNALSGRAANVEKASAQVENVLERRHNLIPNLIAVTKSTLENQNALIQQINAASEAAKSAPSGEAKIAAETKLGDTIAKAQAALLQEGGDSPVVRRLIDEMAGSENRIAVEKAKYNRAAVEYNQAASGLFVGLARPLLGYRASYEVFKASDAAKEAPKF